jgi:hypothetical protein
MRPETVRFRTQLPTYGGVSHTAYDCKPIACRMNHAPNAQLPLLAAAIALKLRYPDLPTNTSDHARNEGLANIS